MFGAPAAGTAAAVLAYRVVLLWVPLLFGPLVAYVYVFDVPLDATMRDVVVGCART